VCERDKSDLVYGVLTMYQMIIFSFLVRLTKTQCCCWNKT